MSHSESEIVLTKINNFISNEINDNIVLTLISKSENKFTTIRFNTLFYDGEEYIMSQIYNHDIFKEFSIGDTVILKKFIILTTVDDKIQIPLNKFGFKLDNTSISLIEKSTKNVSFDMIINKLEIISNLDTNVVKFFNNLKGIVISKVVSYPNKKMLVKYEITNELHTIGISLIMWSNDVGLDEKCLYNFKFINIDKYNGGWQLSTNHFSKFEKIKKMSKVNVNNNFMHLSSSNAQMIMYSNYDMFYMHSAGNLSGRVLDVVKKKECNYQFKVSCQLDGKSKILFMSTFDRSNLFPFIGYAEKEIDNKMLSLIGKEKKIFISVKKYNEKLYFNVTSINKDD